MCGEQESERARAMDGAMQIREAAGAELEDVFEAWDAVPVASGTVAQIYRARLRAPYSLPVSGWIGWGDRRRELGLSMVDCLLHDDVHRRLQEQARGESKEPVDTRASRIDTCARAQA